MRIGQTMRIGLVGYGKGGRTFDETGEAVTL